jgi:Tfp pilus assembly protein FimT
MVLLSTSNRNREPMRGYTMIELVIVFALISMGLALTLFISFGDYTRSSFNDERDVILSTLYKARSQSINNMCFGDSCTDGKTHGVYFGTSGRYVIFQGESYIMRDADVDEVIESNSNAVSVSGVTEVTFGRLRGDATVVPSSATLTVANTSGNTSVITIEPEGRIWWTN